MKKINKNLLEIDRNRNRNMIHGIYKNNKPYTIMQLEDCLEQIKRDLRYKGSDRELLGTRNAVAQHLNVDYDSKMTPSMEKSFLKPFIENLLKQGYGVMFSMSGHLVRVCGITDNHLMIDDPYGEQIEYCPKKYMDKQNNIDNRNGSTSSENQPGAKSTWKWTDIANCQINFIEWYKPKN
jgi:hypothetical protein